MLSTRGSRTIFVFAVAALLSFTHCASAQNGQGQAGQNNGGLRPNVPAAKDKKPSAPAPVKDINGVWAGVAAPRVNAPPPMTAAGQAAFKANKPFFGPALVRIRIVFGKGDRRHWPEMIVAPMRQPPGT